MFISIEQLAAAYGKLGFVQEPGEPFVFKRASDGLLMSHSPTNEKRDLVALFVIQDAVVWEPALAIQLRDAIEEVLESE